jgi:hypothetical protein
LLWTSTLTNQFSNLKALLFPRKTSVSMPNGKTQWMFMCHGLNVALVKEPPLTNLQQHAQCPHWDCLDFWCFYLSSRNEYFLICTTWWNNNGLKVRSCSKLEIVGPKVPSPWVTKQMLGEAFNDLVPPVTHEGFNIFTLFNAHVHAWWCEGCPSIFSIKPTC